VERCGKEDENYNSTASANGAPVEGLKEVIQEMSDDLDKAFDELQASIIEEARKTYSERVIQGWLNPRYMGELENPEGYGKLKGSCGDTIQILLRIRNGLIADARFLTDGCGTTVAASNMACELAIGKRPKEVLGISKEMILEELGGLPEESVHCALLASDTLKRAIVDYIKTKNEPWKRLYRKR
jgi:nitrogen fixation NifU-like protein